MGYYKNATICLNGHVVSSYSSNYSQFCARCGKETISKCSNCNTSIRGSYKAPRTTKFRYSPPSYCRSCGNAFPWTETLLNNAVELISLDDDLSDEVKEIIKHALPDLIVETPSTPLATTKYKKFIPEAAKYVQDGLRSLLVDVVSETVKKSIFG